MQLKQLQMEKLLLMSALRSKLKMHVFQLPASCMLSSADPASLEASTVLLKTASISFKK